MSDHVIDLHEYLKGKSASGSSSAFSIWGGDGERSRFALPMWRATYLIKGDWGALVWGPEDRPGALRPYFVLDLESDPARTDVESGLAEGLWTGDGPELVETPGDRVVVLLGTEGGRRWFLALRGPMRAGPLEAEVRDDLMFLAGECAGLLFHRDLAAEAEEPTS